VIIMLVFSLLPHNLIHDILLSVLIYTPQQCPSGDNEWESLGTEKNRDEIGNTDNEVQSQQSEAFLQEEMEIMKTLDEKLKERDSVMELGVAEIIRKSIELRDGRNPEVRTF
jgi:hypothetical protein